MVDVEDPLPRIIFLVFAEGLGRLEVLAATDGVVVSRSLGRVGHCDKWVGGDRLGHDFQNVVDHGLGGIQIERLALQALAGEAVAYAGLAVQVDDWRHGDGDAFVEFDAGCGLCIVHKMPQMWSRGAWVKGYTLLCFVVGVLRLWLLGRVAVIRVLKSSGSLCGSQVDRGFCG